MECRLTSEQDFRRCKRDLLGNYPMTIRTIEVEGTFLCENFHEQLHNLMKPGSSIHFQNLPCPQDIVYCQ